MNKFKYLAIIAAGLSALSAVRADVLFTESFGYADGTTLTSQGWTASSAGGTNAVTVNGGAVSLTTSGEDVTKNFSTTAISSGSVYTGFDMTVTAAQAGGDYFFTYNLAQSSSTFNSRVYAKSTTGGFLLGVAAVGTGAIVYGTEVLSLSQSYHIVVGYTFVAGTLNDTASVWVSPTTDTATAYASAVWGGAQAEVNLQAIVLRQGGAGTSATISGIDNIVVATDFASAAGLSTVPEPSTYAAIAGGLALVSVIIHRRRKVAAIA